ncbi:class I SAM-dependent methyltransferase [Salinilacihabitans rarus]|uniref:class I SAM-dependent methyltransferase n=1 Tax=Salinilacihabitans rarus TaxID=2961596 RepID=UPI0020C861CE|nr:class I SAM-dependent methyltransferase [Salinilacihabitans rarus]
MRDPLGLLRRGLRRPLKIPRYVFGLLVPSSRWGPTWRKRGGVVRFEPGGYAASPRDRPEFAANLYYEASGLWAALAAHLDERPARSLEVGCGYGRLSPWIAAWSDEFLGVDPDEGALDRAATLYPGLAFAPGRADALPAPADAAGLVVTWTVLQHVDDTAIRAAAAEIERVLSPGGTLVCCERTGPPGDGHLHPRSVGAYDRLFAGLDLVDVRQRPAEPTWGESMPSARPPERLLVFRG